MSRNTAIDNPAIEGNPMFTAWSTITKSLTVAYIAASIANVAGITWTKPLLMPLLLLWALSLFSSCDMSTKQKSWLSVAIVFSFLGDVALMTDAQMWFLIGIGFFALAQISYIALFNQIKGPGLVKAWKIALLPYIGFWVFINILIRPGDLRIPVVIYSALIVGMAVAALNTSLKLNRPFRFVPAIGAGLFMISDTLIAFGEFNEIDVPDGTIMFTYLLGQALIVGGLVLGQTPTGSLSRKR